METVEVPKDVMIGLYRIMCGLSTSFSGAEVYDEALPGMAKAHKWVVNYGNDNNIESHGWDEHQKNKK